MPAKVPHFGRRGPCLADELNFRVGRLTPAFGSFPLRHDPANHRTSDKPLPYDMGRMLRFREWNEGVLPAPHRRAVASLRPRVRAQRGASSRSPRMRGNSIMKLQGRCRESSCWIKIFSRASRTPPVEPGSKKT